LENLKGLTEVAFLIGAEIKLCEAQCSRGKRIIAPIAGTDFLLTAAS
jgi:hypothetical protein